MYNLAKSRQHFTQSLKVKIKSKRAFKSDSGSLTPTNDMFLKSAHYISLVVSKHLCQTFPGELRSENCIKLANQICACRNEKVLSISVSNVQWRDCVWSTAVGGRDRLPLCSSPLTWNQVGLLLLGGTEKPTGQSTEAKTSQRGQDLCFVIGRSGAWRLAPSRRRLERGAQTYATSITLSNEKQISLYL